MIGFYYRDNNERSIRASKRLKELFVGSGFEKRFSVFFESDEFGDFEARKRTIEGGLVLVTSVLVLYSPCYSIFYNIMFGGFERFDGAREFGIFDLVDGDVHIDTI